MPKKTTNPNNCATCDHKSRPDGGHCYMFRHAPTDVCGVHTGRQTMAGFGDLLAEVFRECPELKDELMAAGTVSANA